MSDRYWVGGTGTWNTTSTTNWSATSGGGSGASVPTVADSVFFDQAGTYTVTMTGGLACLDITVSAGTVTFATGTTPSIDIRGSMSLLAGTVWSNTGPITFSSTTTGRTITTNGTVLTGAFSGGAVNFNGAGGGWTLGSALTVGGGVSTPIVLTQGTLDTAGFNITTPGIFSSTGVLTRALVLGAATISAGSGVSGAAWNVTSTGLTLNADTSTIVLGGLSNTFAGAGLTYYNVAFTNTSAASTRNITSANTFNNLSVTAPSTAGITTVTFDSRQTINGTLSTTGTAGNRRVFFASATYGISQDLVVNSAPSLTDADFRGLYVRGTSAPISGTRIGNRGECRGITFDAPKTVYWNLAGAQNWSANGWATTSTGTPSTDNFPLPQDTATFTNAGSVTGTITLDTAIAYCPNVDMLGRTSAMTLGTSNATTVYGNWTNGSGTAFTGTATLTFSGGITQTITSSGKTFSCPITIDTYGGTVQLGSALSCGNFTVTNGTFNTQGYNLTCGVFASNNSNVRTISLGASTVSPTTGGNNWTLTNTTNLTFNAGTSTISFPTTSTNNFNSTGVTYYNVVLYFFGSITGPNTFTNLTFGNGLNNNLSTFNISANQTVTGTLTCSGTTAARRVMLFSGTIGTQRTLTVNSISATDCDFRDINLAGAASGASPTRAGDCGGNTGITFPAPKTVYWNLAGTQDWSATAWATGSGGTPDINQFPLAQDTAVFDNAGSAGTVTINAAWNIGTFDASLRTSAMTLTTSTNNPNVYGDWKFGTGVTSSSTSGTIAFAKNGTQTITSNGVQFGCPVTINHPSGTVQLADALSLNSARGLTLNAGTFDAVAYNVTAGTFTNGGSTTNILKMGSGTWTLSGTGSVWNTPLGAPITFAGTATIVLSDTSTTARTFAGDGRYYNKLTIGGTTGISTLTITGANTFGELASTKTVAHTITFPATQITTIGKWSVTGTVGNVVTVNSSTAATAFTLSIAGPANSGIDYLSVRDCTVLTTSPGEFYVGANSTNVSNNTRVVFTATPAPRTLYWVGGTGNWSSTTKWATSSGGASGAAIPTSFDAVNFDSASNATAYTATIDAGVTLARCASFTMAGPASGNVTFAGTVGIAFHGNVSFAATGITRTYTGAMQWAGNSSYTFTTNGLTLGSACTVIGVGSTWTLGSALNTGTTVFTVTYGSFSTSASNYALTSAGLSSNNSNVRSLSLNGSTVNVSASNTPVTFTTANNFTFNAGTSLISSAAASTFAGGGQTFNNVSFGSPANTTTTIQGTNTFNTLSFTSQTTVGIQLVTFNANQTISTLTLNAGTASAYRTFLASDTIGTTRTLTVGTLTAGAADIDFRDITIAGAAAPISGTRFGDAKGNSGITFPAAKTVYWAQASGVNWGSATSSWSLTNGGSADATAFPLAQDTAFIPFAKPASGSTTTINANYNIGTIDMNERNGSALVTLATSTNTPAIYGNWINGTGTTLSGTGTMTFAGRGSQTITSTGKTFTQNLTINTPGGSVTLLDAFSLGAGSAFSHLAGTFDAATYNVTSANNGSLAIASTGTLTRTLAFGSGTWTSSGQGNPAINIVATGLTITGTSTISLTSSASPKTFAGGGNSYSGITLNQGGAGALTITGNNTFKTITNTYSATGATSIALGATTQTLTNPWTATGAAGRVLTVSGTSAASPGTLIFSGGGQAANVDYLAINNVRAYDLVDEWYAGPNSTNGGSLGWYFVAAGGTVYAVTITETSTVTDSVSANAQYAANIVESGTITDLVSAGFLFLGAISETATGADLTEAFLTALSNISETATGTDAVNAPGSTYNPSLNENATATESISAFARFAVDIAESANISDEAAAIVFRIYLASILEAASGSDVASAKITAQSNIAETATGSDALNTNATLNSQVAETSVAQDIVNGFMLAAAAVSESATGTDQISALRALAAAVVEAVSGSDTVSATAVFQGILQEIATLTDSVNAPGSTYSAPIVELATLLDAVLARATFPVSLNETATGTEAVQATFIPYARIVETATITDAASALAIFAARTVESAYITDQVSPPGSIYNPVVLAVAQLLDQVSPPGSIYNAPVLESATITDSLIGGFLWIDINDDQIANWGDINNVQTTTWLAVDDSQTTNWQNVNNTQTSGWTDVNDTQTPGWTPILP